MIEFWRATSRRNKSHGINAFLIGYLRPEAPPIPVIGRFCQHNTGPPPKSPRKSIDATNCLTPSAEDCSPTYLSMPRNRDALKTANVLWGKSKAKVVEWKPQNYSQGIRYIPVEVSAATSQMRTRESASERPRAETNDIPQGETASQPMDVDETFWADDPVIPNSERRVRRPSYNLLVDLTCLPVQKRLH